MSSKRRIRRRGCLGKQAHASKEAASKHWYSLRMSGFSGYHVYKCPACHAWHVGREKQPDPAHRVERRMHG
jgi:hypothetical protein